MTEKTNALNRIRIYDFNRKTWKSVKFDDPVYLAAGAGTPEFSAAAYRLSYQSPVTPPTIFDVDMATGARTMLKREQVVGGYDPQRYVTRRLWARARDGVKVPLWTVYRKGTRLDGSAPLLLYAYGSYGHSAEATFASSRISLLERGVIYVQAHIRGGTDMGEHWHDDGMLMKKKNTFNDFIVAKLRAYKTDKHPLLLKINMGAGHGGASGRYDALREGAFTMAWMLSQWGIVE